jgi:trans-aconitate 2-methyltransferase
MTIDRSRREMSSIPNLDSAQTATGSAVRCDSWNPDQYARFKHERTQPFYDLLAMVERCSGMRAIDLGCGTGEFTRHLHDTLECVETIGLDNSPAMLARATAFAGDGVRFVVGDIGGVDDGTVAGVEGPFDLVFSNAALHWLGDHHALIPRLASLIAPRGQLVVQVPMNGDHPSHVVAASVAREEPFVSALAGHVRVFGTLAPEAYAELLWRLGAPEPRCVTRVYGHVMASSADVVEWVKGTLLTDYQSRLSPDLFIAFVARYREALRAALGDQSPYYYTFKRVLFQARWPT